MMSASADGILDTRTEARLLLGMLGRIAVIVFVVEAIVMLMLSGWQLTHEVITEGLIDATALTLLASPLIYRWAAKPFAIAAHDAQAALSRELEARSRQSIELESTLSEQRTLLAQNEQLRSRLRQSAVEFSAINERILQRIGADLHDGPAQLLSLVLMRLHKFLPGDGPTPDRADATHEELLRIRQALQDALHEVRNLSAGLVLPELEKLSLSESVFLAIGYHEDRSGTTVSFDIGELPDNTSHELKVCAYRFVQEGLTNALRHAGGKGQRVVAFQRDGRLVIRVLDRGPGVADTLTNSNRGLGLPGLRGRVEAIGGRFELQSTAGDGTSITAIFAIDAESKSGHSNG